MDCRDGPLFLITHHSTRRKRTEKYHLGNAPSSFLSSVLQQGNWRKKIQAGESVTKATAHEKCVLKWSAIPGQGRRLAGQTDTNGNVRPVDFRFPIQGEAIANDSQTTRKEYRHFTLSRPGAHLNLIHNGQLNFLHADGSARSVNRQKARNAYGFTQRYIKGVLTDL